MPHSLHPLEDAGARAAYGELWKDSPHRTPFGHLAFGDAVCSAFGLHGHIASAQDDAGNWTGAALIFEKRVGPARVAALPPLALYSAPVLAAPLDASEAHARISPLDALASAMGRFAQATWMLPPSHTDARPLTWAGWSLATRYTYIGRLPTDPAAFSSAVRRTIGKAEAEFSVVEDAALAPAAARLMRGAFARAGRRFRVPDEATAAVAGALVNAGLARVFAAVPAGGGEPAAALVAAHDDRTAYYWIVGGEPGPATTVLLAHALPELAAGGLAAFDWAGANVPSVAEFKRRFGPELVPVIRARHAAGPLGLVARLRGG
jgi:hypothetical protein